VLISITGGYDLTLFEVDEAANRIRKEVDEEANIIFGSSIDETMNGRIRVSVVATGIDAVHAQGTHPGTQAAAQPAAQPAMAKPEGLTLVPGGRPSRPAVTTAPATPPNPAPRRVAGMPGSFLRPAVNQSAPPAAAPTQALGPVPVVVVEEEPETLAPAIDPQRRPAPVAAQAATLAPPTPPVASGGLRGLFQTVTGRSAPLMRRNLPEPAPVAPRLDPAPARTPARAAPEGEIGLEIPTFLRRQSN
jgi:cell division protein FtsZ